jgi:hypothetical protein
MRFLNAQSESLSGQRDTNSQFPLADVLKSAFAMFSLKSPSLLNFKKQTVLESSNLQSIYHLVGEIACDNQNCPHCITRKRHNGVVFYPHAGLSAVLVNPAKTWTVNTLSG